MATPFSQVHEDGFIPDDVILETEEDLYSLGLLVEHALDRWLDLHLNLESYFPEEDGLIPSELWVSNRMGVNMYEFAAEMYLHDWQKCSECGAICHVVDGCYKHSEADMLEVSEYDLADFLQEIEFNNPAWVDHQAIWDRSIRYWIGDVISAIEGTLGDLRYVLESADLPTLYMGVIWAAQTSHKSGNVVRDYGDEGLYDLICKISQEGPAAVISQALLDKIGIMVC